MATLLGFIGLITLFFIVSLIPILGYWMILIKHFDKKDGITKKDV